MILRKIIILFFFLNVENLIDAVRLETEAAKDTTDEEMVAARKYKREHPALFHEQTDNVNLDADFKGMFFF